MSEPAYGFLDRLLHRLALGSTSIAEMSFDLDQGKVQSDPADIVPNRHVFVAGLARAGTTVLMRRFHATGEFRSLIYRDMPFVLAPNLWKKLSAVSKRDIEASERAHGDRIVVDADSPESLEEVFWRVFSGDEYIAKDRLTPYEPDDEVIERFVRYVNAVLSTETPRRERYLSKNNNNIVRLGALRRAFPNALILLPFRQPLAQARSLLRQHERFCETHKVDRFALSYMTWLSHHEFGLDHRPFVFDDDPRTRWAPESIDYWLDLWCETYAWLADRKPEAAVFVCYEDLCADADAWNRLAELAELDVEDGGEPFRLSATPTESGDAQPGLVERARALYERLTTSSRSSS